MQLVHTRSGDPCQACEAERAAGRTLAEDEPYVSPREVQTAEIERSNEAFVSDAEDIVASEVAVAPEHAPHTVEFHPARHLELDAAAERRRSASPGGHAYCIDEICTCGQHRCPIEVPRVPFSATTHYRDTFRNLDPAHL